MHVTVCEPIEPADWAASADPVGGMMAEWQRRVGEALRRAYARWAQ